MIIGGDEGTSNCWSIKPWTNSGSSMIFKGASSRISKGACSVSWSTASGYPPRATGLLACSRIPLCLAVSNCNVFLWGIESVLSLRDGGALARSTGLAGRAIDSSGVAGLRTGTDWHNSMPRLGLFENFNVFVFLFWTGSGGGGGGGGGDLTGDGSLGGSDPSWRAESTFVIRFEALTGGDEGGGRG